MGGNKFAVVHNFTHWLWSHLQGVPGFSPLPLQPQQHAWSADMEVIFMSCCVGQEQGKDIAVSAA